MVLERPATWIPHFFFSFTIIANHQPSYSSGSFIYHHSNFPLKIEVSSVQELIQWLMTTLTLYDTSFNSYSVSVDPLEARPEPPSDLNKQVPLSGMLEV